MKRICAHVLRALYLHMPTHAHKPKDAVRECTRAYMRTCTCTCIHANVSVYMHSRACNRCARRMPVCLCVHAYAQYGHVCTRHANSRFSSMGCHSYGVTQWPWDKSFVVTVLSNFFHAVRQAYHDENPYHNFYHAFTVCQVPWGCSPNKPSACYQPPAISPSPAKPKSLCQAAGSCISGSSGSYGAARTSDWVLGPAHWLLVIAAISLAYLP